MSEPRKIGWYVGTNTTHSFKIEKTCDKFGYFIFFLDVALYVFYTIIQSDLVRNKIMP